MRFIKVIYFIWFCLRDISMRKDWSNFTLYEVTAYNDRERAFLYFLHVKELAVVFFNRVSNEAALSMNILAHNSCSTEFENKLREFNIQFSYGSSFYLADQTKVKIENVSLDTSKAFLTWEATERWIGRTERKYSIIEKKVIGITSQKRNIVLVKISKGKKNAAVLVTAGEDGKDWTSSAVVLNFINIFQQSRDLLQLLDYYELYFVPNCNPDGYTRCIEHESVWSKNRRFFFPRKRCSNGRDAMGVNIDRNWFLDHSAFDSDNECDGVYIGQETISEEETKALFSVLMQLSDKLMAFINVKGFGSMITIPYAGPEHSNNHDLMMELLPSVTDKLETIYNATYFYGTTGAFFFNYSNNMADWVKAKLNVPVVYTVHLQHEQDFFPNPNFIPELTSQFATIFNDTLMLAKDIYGPLFNRQSLHSQYTVPVSIALTYIIRILVSG